MKLKMLNMSIAITTFLNSNYVVVTMCQTTQNGIKAVMKE